MVPAPVVIDERERLADLRALSLLDTPAEERFERIVRLLIDVFQVPIAYIALVDADRQWFKSQRGLPVAQTPRDVSFCGHTIAQDELLIVPDTTRDARFHDNPLVTRGPQLRFYAGYPLAGPNGHHVGTICLADTSPRQFSAREVETFREIATLAERELNMFDLVRVQRELLTTKNKLMAAQAHLASELAQAAEYVQSLLPPPLTTPVRTDWRFISSSQLGGDLFGYHERADGTLALYLLDVAGHGVGSALLSVSVGNALRREALPDTDFGRPERVLHALDHAFPMDENYGMFFTIWYGVYDPRTRALKYSAGGHHPAIVLHAPSGAVTRLETRNLVIGLGLQGQFETRTYQVQRGDCLYVFSDGVMEVFGPDGKWLALDGFVAVLRETPTGNGRLDHVVATIRGMSGGKLEDDFSLLEVAFDPA
jgi:sigma-B regulation protein RsbU (phosphoserine phosphatase)